MCYNAANYFLTKSAHLVCGEYLGLQIFSFLVTEQLGGLSLIVNQTCEIALDSSLAPITHIFDNRIFTLLQSLTVVLLPLSMVFDKQ